MATIPDPNGQQVKEGDQVKITSGELIGYVGEVVEMVQDGKNWIKKVKIYKDGGYTIVEVKDLTIEFVAFADKIVKSGVFKKFVSWIKNLF
ncbi:MAG: hypothetical protein ACW98F_20195, partial [Candidatus Hodarchaeales archaeon]